MRETISLDYEVSVDQWSNNGLYNIYTSEIILLKVLRVTTEEEHRRTKPSQDPRVTTGWRLSTHSNKVIHKRTDQQVGGPIGDEDMIDAKCDSFKFMKASNLWH